MSWEAMHQTNSMQFILQSVPTGSWPLLPVFHHLFCFMQELGFGRSHLNLWYRKEKEEETPLPAGYANVLMLFEGKFFA